MNYYTATWRSFILLIITIFCTTSFTQAKISDAELEKLLPVLRGEFDMSDNPRRYIVYMTFDQPGNRFPSFWTGRNDSGTATFNARMDLLTGGLELNHSGAITFRITNTANKHGMEDVIPGGEMRAASPGRDHEFTFTIERITNPVFKQKRRTRTVTGEGSGIDASYIEFDADFAGKAAFDGKSVPFKATGTIGFNDAIQQFRLHMTFDLPIADLGITGGNGNPVKVQFYTRSSVSTKLPDAADMMNMDSLLPF